MGVGVRYKKGACSSIRVRAYMEPEVEQCDERGARPANQQEQDNPGKAGRKSGNGGRVSHLPLRDRVARETERLESRREFFGPDGVGAPFGFAGVSGNDGAKERDFAIDGIGSRLGDQGADGDDLLGGIGDRDPGVMEAVTNSRRRHLGDGFAGELPGKIRNAVANDGGGYFAQIDFE